MKVLVGRKRTETYKGLLVKADWRLHDQVVKRLVAVKPPPADVLDFGAGEGALALRLADAGYCVKAVDIDRQAFKCPAVEFECVNFNDDSSVKMFTERERERYDAVLGIEVIEHVENPWKYVRDLALMLRPGGILLVTTPNITSWLSRFTFLLLGRFHQFEDTDVVYGHVAPISGWELRLVMEQSGLSDVSVCSAGTLPAVWFTGLNRLLIVNTFMLLLRPFMRGLLDGWCVMAVGRKNS